MTVAQDLSIPDVLIDVPASNGRGKGRIKARRSATDPSTRAALQVQPAPPSEELPAPRFPKWLLDGFVARFDVSQAREHNAAWELLRTGQPAAFTACPLVAALLEPWSSLSCLAEAFGSRRKAVDVLCADERAGAFLEHDPGKNIYGGFYHVREPSTRHLPMSFLDFAGCLASWTSKKVLIREVVMQRGAPETKAQACKDLGPLLQEDLAQRIDWAWLQDTARAHQWGAVTRVTLEVGSADGLQPARYNCFDRLMAQVSGRRRVLLIGPEHAHAGMYAFPAAHTYDRYAQPDLDAPDLAAWPRLGDTRGQSIVLRPGDALFVPAYWFAHVQDMNEAATSLEVRMACGLRLQSRAAMRLAISRLIEERVAEVVGIQDVRRWLLVIARDGEEDSIDVGTVAGYRRVVMCQEVRDEIAAVLGCEACVAEVLRALCDKRLIPTPWLNQAFREPLYLTDRPVQLPDTRTEEEIKYPELFRHRSREAAAALQEPQRITAS